jgi:hypothetical protein
MDYWTNISLHFHMRIPNDPWSESKVHRPRVHLVYSIAFQCSMFDSGYSIVSVRRSAEFIKGSRKPEYCKNNMVR